MSSITVNGLSLVVNTDNFMITVTIALTGERIRGQWVYTPKITGYSIVSTARTYDVIDDNLWDKLVKERETALAIANKLYKHGRACEYVKPQIFETLGACYPNLSMVLELSPSDILGEGEK